MQPLLPNIQIKVNENIYLKDPESSDLGKKIISESIKMLDDLGFEAFTFKKLGVSINSTEASIYRYFENKHKLLLYLTSWYWNWLEYKLVFGIANIQQPENRLKKAIAILTEVVKVDNQFTHINEITLNKIVIAESPKVYLNKTVDEVNKEGVFSSYKQLVARVSEIILEINPKYKFPHMLISTVIEGAHQQRYFAEHLPRLTDKIKGEDAVPQFYTNMVFSTIQ